ncbi:SET and MYND domain-containing protein 3, partial [Nowakowskiella sp. JEL0407]
MGKTDSSNSQSVESLQSNISKFPPSTLQNFQILSYLFPSYTSSTSTSPNGPDPSHIESLLAKLSTNTFCPTEPDLTPIAVGVYLTLAMVNHDCDPNCFVLFSGGKAVLRNLKFINEGEE